MSNRQTKPLSLVLAGLIAVTVLISKAKTPPCVAQTVAPSPSPIPSPTPSASPSPSPSPTPSIEERLNALESQVADLKKDMNVSRFKEVIEIVQKIVTVAAVIIGGVWSYRLFIENRQKYPRAGITHHITHRQVGDKVLLHVGVTISNLGNVLLSLISLETRIQQVFPLPDEVLEAINSGQNPVPEGETEVPWPLIDSQKLELERGECEVEPGERQEIHHDFILDAEVETIEVYTYLINEQKREREIAWDLTTLYELNERVKVLPYKEEADGKEKTVKNVSTTGTETGETSTRTRGTNKSDTGEA